MNIFITGATGYIGNHLAKTLAEQGNKVHALCRSKNKKALLDHPNIIVFEGDITEPASIEAAMRGCEEAYHLAAFARVWAKDVSIYRRLNVEATQHILDAARKLNVRKIVFTSTAGVLGPSGNRPVREDDARIGAVLNEYEETKTEAEALCRRYVKDYGMNVVIVNPPRVYGPGLASESNALTRLAELYWKGKWWVMPGDGKRVGSYVHVKDVVQGHILAMEKGRSGERYTLSGENASYQQFFDTLGKVTGKKRWLIKLPVNVMLIAGSFMMLRTRLTGKAPLITPKWIKKYLYNWALSCEKAQRELGYTYMPLQEGLRDTIDWIRQNKA